MVTLVTSWLPTVSQCFTVTLCHKRTAVNRAYNQCRALAPSSRLVAVVSMSYIYAIWLGSALDNVEDDPAPISSLASAWRPVSDSFVSEKKWKEALRILGALTSSQNKEILCSVLVFPFNLSAFFPFLDSTNLKIALKFCWKIVAFLTVRYSISWPWFWQIGQRWWSAWWWNGRRQLLGLNRSFSQIFNRNIKNRSFSQAGPMPGDLLCQSLLLDIESVGLVEN